MVLCGIDYGNKKAGTTAVAIWSDQTNEVQLFQSIKGSDADQFILDQVRQHRPDLIGLDAPLSLPGIYRGIEGCEDYFYRECDRELKAMSPMFIGGLTARAMKLGAQLARDEVSFYEVYPKHAAGLLDWVTEGYKQGKAPDPSWGAHWKREANWIIPDLTNWHQADALLALFSTWRIAQGKGQCFGKPEEGLIWG